MTEIIHLAIDSLKETVSKTQIQPLSEELKKQITFLENSQVKSIQQQKIIENTLRCYAQLDPSVP
jgi:hypothetical protein